MTERRAFRDDAEDCAICLDALSDSRCITLSCGHVWHLHCVREQLQLAAPDVSKPLIFTGYRCAKCSAYCDHPLLNDVIRPISHLRHQVERMILQQARVDGIRVNHPHDDAALLRAAAPLYAFYLCSLCEQPYFGGSIACADRLDALPSDDRVCSRCSPRTGSVCTQSQHAPSYIWKCRFCCEPSRYVCYGSTHLCDRCHDEDDAQGGLVSITPKQCAGKESCPWPMKAAQQRHENGSAARCEQLYYCAACTSDPLGTAHVLRFERSSRNLLFNPSGQIGLDGWYQLSRMHWSTEQSQVPLNPATSFNFVSSYEWCIMAQVIDLRPFARFPSSAVLQVSVRHMARTDCPSVMRLQTAVYDQHFNELKHFCTDELQPPPDFWDERSIEVPPTEHACFVVVVVHGKDTRFWQGLYGAKIADVAVRVVLDDSVRDESQVLLEQALPNTTSPLPRLSTATSLRVLTRFVRNRYRL
ncbi:E3 ubiquitin-protein ligase highwire [Gracilariopsis chorda]|uniref:E3 ubiquitin-protein ligase highwire n=1 Tax=Gracilariopsis chorda TaxID=448386 RepID=A0A2V3J4Q4_9FLOR|nr:E3 ubiquitin-protein ligase highwire [Gracilariopsis chorda]|eukprot:PXF48977.1 E3 ubiquitin-protein ligase highwire [Gracilariopsis chorda]